MHSLARALAAAALACLPGLALPGLAKAGPAEDASAVIDHWVAAFSANDAAALVKLYAPDAVLLGTSSPVMLDGTAAIRGYFERLPGSGNSAVIRELRLMVLSSDAVLATGFYDFSMRHNANASAAPARFTIVVVRRGDGWVIVHHHSSPRTKAPM